MRDLLVAGGGPVGLAVALHARRAGLDVAVWEPRERPVDKACGEGLMPAALVELGRLGIEPEGHPLDGIRYLGGGREATAPFSHGPGRGVRRTELQRAMTQAVHDEGVPVERRAVDVVEQRDDHVRVDGVATRYLVAADGLHSPVRRSVGLDRPASGRRRYGQRLHVTTAPWSSYVEVHWSAGAEAYVTPVAPDLVGVAVLTEHRRSFEDVLAEFPELVERLGRADRSRVRGAGPLRQQSHRRTTGRVLLVGDAAGYVDALTGEGIALGLAQARAAVEAVRADSPASYERSWRRLGRRHVALTKALLMASRQPVVRAHLVPTAARFPVVFRAAVDQLARPA